MAKNSEPLLTWCAKAERDARNALGSYPDCRSEHEDIAQEALLETLEKHKREPFETDAQAIGYAVATAKHRASKIVKKMRATEELQPCTASNATSGDATSAAVELRETFNRWGPHDEALASLETKKRQAVVARARCQTDVAPKKTKAELAKGAGISERQMIRRIYGAIKDLRKVVGVAATEIIYSYISQPQRHLGRPKRAQNKKPDSA